MVRKVWCGVLVLILGTFLPGAKICGASDPERFNAVLEQTTVTFGNSVDEVIRRMGPPQKEDVRPDVSPHDPSSHFEWVHLTYPDLQLTLFRAPDKEFLVQVIPGGAKTSSAKPSGWEASARTWCENSENRWKCGTRP